MGKRARDDRGRVALITGGTQGRGAELAPRRVAFPIHQERRRAGTPA